MSLKKLVYNSLPENQCEFRISSNISNNHNTFLNQTVLWLFGWKWYPNKSCSDSTVLFTLPRYNFLGLLEFVCYSRVGIIGGNAVANNEIECSEYSIKLKEFLIVSYTVYRSSCQLRPPLRGPFRCSFFLQAKLNWRIAFMWSGLHQKLWCCFIQLYIAVGLSS